MCYSAEVSLAAYLVGLYGCSILWQHNLKSEAVFYGWVVQMQLIEYLMWLNHDCGSNNREITKWGIIINHLEPFVLWLAIMYFQQVTLPRWLNVAMVLFGLVTIWYTKVVYNVPNGSASSCTQVTEESKPHLYWAWNEGSYANEYYLLFLLSLVLLSWYGLGKNGDIHAVLVLLSFAVSKYVYEKSHATGALWCLAAAAAPVAILMTYR